MCCTWQGLWDIFWPPAALNSRTPRRHPSLQGPSPHYRDHSPVTALGPAPSKTSVTNSGFLPVAAGGLCAWEQSRYFWPHFVNLQGLLLSQSNLRTEPFAHLVTWKFQEKERTGSFCCSIVLPIALQDVSERSIISNVRSTRISHGNIVRQLRHLQI